MVHHLFYHFELCPSICSLLNWDEIVHENFRTLKFPFCELVWEKNPLFFFSPHRPMLLTNLISTEIQNDLEIQIKSTDKYIM